MPNTGGGRQRNQGGKNATGGANNNSTVGGGSHQAVYVVACKICQAELSETEKEFYPCNCKYKVSNRGGGRGWMIGIFVLTCAWFRLIRFARSVSGIMWITRTASVPIVDCSTRSTESRSITRQKRPKLSLISSYQDQLPRKPVKVLNRSHRLIRATTWPTILRSSWIQLAWRTSRSRVRQLWLAPTRPNMTYLRVRPAKLSNLPHQVKILAALWQVREKEKVAEARTL